MHKLKVKELLEIIGEAEIFGSTSNDINNLNRIDSAVCGELTFLESDKYEKYLPTTLATAVLVKDDSNFLPKENQIFIKTKNPYLSFLKLVHFFETKPRIQNGVHQTAVVESSAKIGKNASIGANAYIGENSVIGENTVIYPNCSIQNNVIIGNNCTVYSNVSIYYDCEIGNDCIIHSGVVIGSDGFGFQENPDGSYSKIPQIGNVIIKNDVEIGANTTIDRSFVGSTIIENGVKLDNLIQIAHNVEVGENSAMAAQVGISGSAKIGKRNRYGGQVGVAGHLEMADDVTLLAKSGVAKTVPLKGVYFGAPIHDRMTGFKIEAVIHTLPELARDIAKIKKKLGID